MFDGVFTIPIPGQFPADEPSLPAGVSRGGPLGEYLAGPENQLAVAAVLALLSRHEKTQAWIGGGGPLVLSGPAGSGKSHLAGGLAYELRRRDPQIIVRSLLAAEYARELALAIDTQAVADWESRYRKCDVLIVEDLDHLTPKEAPQEHLARTIDVLLRRGALIVVTATNPPAGMAHLTAALRSRLRGGLVVALALPGVEARKQILERLAGQQQLTISSREIELLAAGIPGSVRDLAGALVYLRAAARNAQQDRGGRVVIGERETLNYLAGRRAAATPSLATIAGRTARHFGLRPSKLRGTARHKNLALARNMAMYLARHLTDCTFASIGEFFGGRDHTTAMHACQRIVHLAEVDPGVRRSLAALRAELSC